MNTKTAKCQAHSGTYMCNRPAGHVGRHNADAKNNKVPVWSNSYEMKFYPVRPIN